MKMTRDKQRIERIIASTDGIRQAEPPPFLFTRIAARLDEAVREVPKSRVRLAMIAAALLVLANAGSVIVTSRSATEPIHSAAAAQYQSGDLSLDSFNGGE